jgi:hypothetical protein
MDELLTHWARSFNLSETDFLLWSVVMVVGSITFLSFCRNLVGRRRIARKVPKLPGGGPSLGGGSIDV